MLTYFSSSPALITISTRASLKKYHTFTLTLHGPSSEDEPEWEFQRIGTLAEKSSVEKELQELRDHLAKVEEWKQRRQEIEDELNKVLVEGGEELPAPAYEKQEDESAEASDSFEDAAASEEVTVQETAQ